MKTIFDYPKTIKSPLIPHPQGDVTLPEKYLRRDCQLVSASELEVVRHYTRLSQSNFAIDTHFYPLGSCTMKYNPKVANHLAQLPGFSHLHPQTPVRYTQGILRLLYELKQMLAEISGMKEVSLAPMAGAHGEFAGVSMIRAYHAHNCDYERTEILIPDAAHGTNPASAAMAGFKVREIPTDLKTGDLDLEKLQNMLGPKTAGIMLTNPSTLGVFERQIDKVAQMVHEAGGLLYYDGANLNAILGKVKPGDMGFDVIHINLHKTFSTPHGGGGPGAGPIGVSKRLIPFLPKPHLVESTPGYYEWQEPEESIGRLSAFYGNVGVLIRAYVYMKILGNPGMARIAHYATLNANYLMKKLQEAGYTPALSERMASHEFILTLKKEAEEIGMTAKDLGKRLLDYGIHAPTTYFPLLIQECLLIEPTETESKETLDEFVEVMKKIRQEAQENPEIVQTAPQNLTFSRLDDVKAAKDMILTADMLP